MNMVIYHPGIAKMAFPGTEPKLRIKKVSGGEREKETGGKEE